MSYKKCLEKISVSEVSLFSLRYGDEDISNIDKLWEWKDESNVSENKGAIKHRRIYLSGDGLLQLTCEMTEFVGSNVLEWILYLENPGNMNSRLISDLLPLNINFPVDENTVPSVLYSKGCFPEAGVDNYALCNYPLKPKKNFHISSDGGKTSKYIPFFNICDKNCGYIGALGWLGQWSISAGKVSSNEVNLKGGMDNIRLYLKPGEKIRTPRVLLMPWKGDWIDAHNMLRRHNLSYNTPHYNGKPVEVPISYSCWGGFKTEHALKLMEQFEKENIAYDAFWMDAGWYGPDREEDEYQVFGEEDWYLYAGDWRVNKISHPGGLKPISDAAHEHHMKYVLWFEPERVVIGTPISQQHPEWIIGDVGKFFAGNKALPYVRNSMFDFGNEEAVKWMIDEIDNLINEIGIDVFRQDLNMRPLWDISDAQDRSGMTQIRYVEGLLIFWDELRRRHPNLLLDVCQRGDLDTISRAVDLCRSDYAIAPESDPMGNQVATMGLSFWMAHYGTLICIKPNDNYHMRSAFAPGVGITLNGTREQLADSEKQEMSFEWTGSLIKQLHRARPYYYGDYYPLTVSDLNRSSLFGNPRAYEETVCSLERSDWCAYEMNRADLGEGMVMVLKRPYSPYCCARFPLRGLDANCTYEIEDADTKKTVYATGQELMQQGLAVEIEEKPGSRLYFYKRMP